MTNKKKNRVAQALLYLLSVKKLINKEKYLNALDNAK